jgi:hypothetical protein
MFPNLKELLRVPDLTLEFVKLKRSYC